MFSTPAQPNLTDYVSFLAGAGIPPPNTPSTPNAAAVFPTASGTATGGDSQTVTDSTQDWDANQWVPGFSVQDVTQNLIAPITANDDEDLNLGIVLTSPVQAGDAYLIVPNIAVVSLNIALAIVNKQICLASPDMYVLAVYNLATDRLINYAPDQPGQSFFKDLRANLRLNDVSLGVISSGSDAGTAAGVLNPEQFKRLTLQDLGMLKTFWGRAYLGIAQSVGALWGLS